MHGCTKPRKQPRSIGPYELTRCPNYYLSNADSLRDSIINAYTDFKAGVIQAWPDGWAGAIEEGVRFLNNEVNACQVDMMKESQRQHQRDRVATAARRR